MSGSNTLGRREQLAALSEVWLLLLGMGVLLMIVGAAAIGSSYIATLATILIFGVHLLVGGILQLIACFCGRGWRGFILHLLSGILYIVAGLLLIDHPGEVAIVFTLIIAVGLLVGGVLRIVLSLAEQFEGWGLVLLNGVVSVLLGLAIWKRWPLDGLWVIGLFVGIEMLFSGLSWVTLALAVRAAPKPEAAS